MMMNNLSAAEESGQQKGKPDRLKRLKSHAWFTLMFSLEERLYSVDDCCQTLELPSSEQIDCLLPSAEAACHCAQPPSADSCLTPTHTQLDDKIPNFFRKLGI
jgi:hypothetical protein